MAGCTVQDLPSSSGWLYRARCARPTQFIWLAVQSKVCKTYPVHLACCTRAAPWCPLLPVSAEALSSRPAVAGTPSWCACQPCKQYTSQRRQNLFRPIAVFLRIREISHSKQLAVPPSMVWNQSKQLAVSPSTVWNRSKQLAVSPSTVWNQSKQLAVPPSTVWNQLNLLPFHPIYMLVQSSTNASKKDNTYAPTARMVQWKGESWKPSYTQLSMVTTWMGEMYMTGFVPDMKISLESNTFCADSTRKTMNQGPQCVHACNNTTHACQRSHSPGLSLVDYENTQTT